MLTPILLHTGTDFCNVSRLVSVTLPPTLIAILYYFSMVLTLCARSKEPGAAVRASNILDSMEYLYSQGHTEVVANSRCYSAVITAWARSGSPDTVKQAFALIDRMEQNKRIGSPHGRPNAHCYNACIHAVAKSSESDKVKYCLDILQRMNDARDAGDLDSAPTLVTYSTIVNGKWHFFVKLMLFIPTVSLHSMTNFCLSLQHVHIPPVMKRRERRRLNWLELASSLC